jgi:hypothetical protein
MIYLNIVPVENPGLARVIAGDRKYFLIHHHSQIVPPPDPVVSTEPVEVDSALFGNGVPVDEPAHGWRIIPEPVVQQPRLLILPLGGEPERVALGVDPFAAEQVAGRIIFIRLSNKGSGCYVLFFA